MKQKCLMLLFVLALLPLCNTLRAQTVVNAIVDNYVVEPYGRQSLNVLKNDEVSCDRADIGITVTANPAHGTIQVEANKTITYAPIDDYFGEDVFTYRIVCNGKASTAKVYIQVADRPDNMVPEVCAITPPKFEWKIREAMTSASINLKVTVARPWYVGNLDNDPKDLPEIVAHGGNNQPDLDEGGNKITIFKDGNLSDALIINTNSGDKPFLYNEYYSVSSIGLSRFSPQAGARANKGAIVVSGRDGYLYAYSYPGGAREWRSSEPYVYNYGGTAAANLTRSGASIAFADFDADEKIEIYVGNKIFSLDDGKLLCEGGINNEKGFSPQSNAINGGMVSVAVDVDHDGYPDLVAGTTVYSVVNNGGSWSMSIKKQLPAAKLPKLNSGASVWRDGHVSLVDLNNDGYVDAVVQTLAGTTSTNMKFMAYGWDIKNNEVLFSYEPTVPAGKTGIGSRSLAFIGDLTGDGIPEIAFIEEAQPNSATERKANLKAFKLPGTLGPAAKLQLFWSLPIQEAAGRTGISLFDFNLDGVAEMLYRDEETLRIIDGSKNPPKTLAQLPSKSATTWEMPIVADIDGDGAAEIICAGGESTSKNQPGVGHMKIYKSGNSSQWAPARNVWNQYAYNPTFVNKDLTVPLSPLNMATSLQGADGVVRRPFNNFLQQAPIMTMEGISLFAAANLSFDNGVSSRLIYDESIDEVTVSFGIQNDGSIAYKGTIDVQLYAYSSTTSTYAKVGNKFVFGNASYELDKLEKVDVSYKIKPFSSFLPADYDSWFLAINTVDDSPNAPKTFAGQAECKSADNMTSRLSFVSKERTICEGVTEELILPDTQAYRWYSTFTGGDTIATLANKSNILEVTKNDKFVQYLFVESYRKGDLGNPSARPIVSVRDTIFVYLTPDSLVWTGGFDGDWHDYLNWENPNDVFNIYPKANIPRPCTNVLIRDGLTIYPDLSPSVTRSAEYINNECNNIHFEHGGSLSQPERLAYAKAYVDVNLESNRWTMFSPPLLQLYSADIYMKYKDPFKDDVFVGTRLFSEKNPQTGFYKEGAWTGKFNTPSVDFKAGTGLAVWINDKKEYPSLLVAPHDPHLFQFPKHDLQHHVYVNEGNIIPGQTYDVARGKEHRFVFDGLPNALGTFTAPFTSAGAGKLYLIGNPYMAHLDFEKLRAANPGKLAAYYQVMDENGVYQYYNKAANTLSKNIPPMQSFIVEATKAFSDGLQFNGTMTSAIPDQKLKSSKEGWTQAEDLPDADILTINLQNPDRAGFVSSTSVILNPEASLAYVVGEDVPKILFTYSNFLDEANVIYTKSIDSQGVMLAVNELGTADLDSLDVPLGIRAAKEGQDLTFFITGQWNFAKGYGLYLFDKYENKRYDLRDASWYSFKNTAAQPFLDDRFVIEIGSRQGTGIEEIAHSAIRVIGSKDAIVIETGNGESIESVKVYDLQGRLISQKINSDNILRIAVGHAAVYVVEVVTASESTVQKVITY